MTLSSICQTSLTSQNKAAFIRGLDDNTLVRKLLSKPSFTFDDCTKYALEYEQTEDRLGTHKKNSGITVSAVTAQDSELSPGKQINQIALVCDHCDKPGHRVHEMYYAS